MITHVQMVTVRVRDLDRAVRFYTSVLGFAKYAEWDAGPGDRITWVCPQPALPIELATGIGLAEVAPGAQPPGGFTGIVFAARDVEATCRDLRQRGVAFTVEPRHPPGEPPSEREARFTDQDGNEFLIHT